MSEGTWELWDDKSRLPIEYMLTEEEAIAKVDKYHEEGRTDVYAEDTNSPKIYEGKN